MTTLALYHPDTLIAMELRQALDQVQGTFDRVIGLTHEPEDVGNLIDVAGHAVRVEELTAAALDQADLLISCADTFRSNLPLLTALESCETPPPDVLFLAPDTPLDAGEAFVPGVHSPKTPFPSAFAIAHPAVILLSRLFSELQELGIESTASTVLQPASILGQDAMNEVFGQARSLLTMDGSLPTERFGYQTAFSTAPSRHGGDAGLHRDRLNQILGSSQHELQVLQAGAFHGLGLSAHVRFERSVDAATFAAALTKLESNWELLEDDAGTVGRAEADRPGWTSERSADGDSAWFWIAADHLAHAVAPTAIMVVDAWFAARSPS